jgi:hypothetical protein
MLKKYAALTSLPIFFFYPNTTFAEDAHFQFSGVANSNYQYKDYVETEKSKLNFNDVTLSFAYQRDNWGGLVTARCYQFDELCDFSVLSDAYFTYQFNPNQLLSVGLQPIPFGVDTYWDASYYESMMYTLGMQDTHNLGFRYDQQTKQHQWSIGYFPTDGGHHIGSSKDAARYSANLIKGDQPDTTRIQEQHMLFGKYSYHDQYAGLDYKVGTSVWYSLLDNQNTHKTGSRFNSNVFAKSQKNQLDTTLTFGYQDINNGQADLNYSTLGSFDTEYNLTNQAYYYVADIGYKFPDRMQNLTGFRPYLVLSGLIKKDNLPNSYRNIAGLQFDYKQLRINAEYMFAKNDAFIGGDMNAFADSKDTEWKQMLNVNFAFNF